jgi:transposase
VDADPRTAELEAENLALRARVAELNEQVAALAGKVAELEKLLRRDSSNSSKPPSSDPGSAKSARPENANRAARRAMGRKQGKQPGTPGHTLAQVADPDVVVVHRPDRCAGCERPLDDAEVVATSSRQVFDVPDPTVVVTEHRVERRRCTCGCETAAAFPPEATAPACYGPSIKAHAIYLMCSQHLPRERCAQALADLFGVSVSTGTLDNWMREAADALVGFLAVVAAQLAAAPVVHADETSVRSGKAALWVHVWCTALVTMLHVGRRNKATVEAGPLGDYAGTIVHDRLAMYFGYGRSHVLCNAHILRSLNELLGNDRHRQWARGFIELITETKKIADAARVGGQHQLSQYQRRKIRRRWNDLCDQAAGAAPPPTPGTKLYGTNNDARLLAVALAEHRDLFLAYTRDLSLPFDNNRAERDLRMIKLQAKISGEFRSINGATRFAAIRSYISTNRKQTQPIHRHLKDLFTPTGAWLPTPA